MADIYSQIVQALAKQRQSIEDENPWVSGGVNVGRSPIEYDNRNNTKDVIGASIVQSIIGGLMRGYGRGRANREQEAFDTELSTAQQSESPVMSMQNSANSRIREMAPIFANAEFVSKEKRIQKQLDLQDQLNSKLNGIGIGLDKETMQYGKTGNLPDIMNELAEDKAAAIARGRARYPSAQSGLAPISEAAMPAIVDSLMEQGLSEPEANSLARDPAALKQFVGLSHLGYRGDTLDQGRDRIGIARDNLTVAKDRQAFNESKFDLANYSNLSGTPPSPGTKKELENKIITTGTILNTLEGIRQIGDERGYNNLLGADAQVLEAKVSTLFDTYRKYKGAGANLTGPEIALINSMVPVIPGRGVGGAIKALVLGRNQNTFISAMKKLAQQNLDHEVYSLGFARKGVDNEKHYPQETRERYSWGNRKGKIGEEQPSHKSGGEHPPKKLDGVPYRAIGNRKFVQTGESSWEPLSASSKQRAKQWLKRK